MWKTLTKHDIAELLRFSARPVGRIQAKAQLPAPILIGRSVLLSKRDLDDWIAARAKIKRAGP